MYDLERKICITPTQQERGTSRSTCYGKTGQNRLSQYNAIMLWRRKQDIGSQPRANQISKVCKIAHLRSALILSSQQPNEKVTIIIPLYR